MCNKKNKNFTEMLPQAWRQHYKTLFSSPLIPILAVIMFVSHNGLDTFFFICQNDRKHVFLNSINDWQFDTLALLDFLQIRLCDRQREGQTEIEAAKRRRELMREKQIEGKGGWERWRGQSKEIRRELNEKCTEEKQIFYIWSSDSSEGGRERKDKMKK